MYRVLRPVLSPMKRIQSTDDFILGEHGIYIKRGWHSATYLPQVAHETGWSKERFLSQCCMKGGMAPDAWKKKDTELFIYTAQVLGEKK